MSAQDPGAATGGPIREPGRCASCHHLEPLHTLTNGKRRGCSCSTCPCPTYTPEETR